MFTVKWSASASADLAVWLLAHPNRADEIDEAAEQSHEKLTRDPTGNGEHLSEGLWRIEVRPLATLFTVESNEVRIATVHWIG